MPKAAEKGSSKLIIEYGMSTISKEESSQRWGKHQVPKVASGLENLRGCGKTTNQYRPICGLEHHLPST